MVSLNELVSNIVELNLLELQTLQKQLSQIQVDDLRNKLIFCKKLQFSKGKITPTSIWLYLDGGEINRLDSLLVAVNSCIQTKKWMQSKEGNPVVVTKPDGESGEIMEATQRLIKNATKEIILLGFDHGQFGTIKRDLSAAKKRGVHIIVIGAYQFVKKMRKTLSTAYGSGKISMYAFDKDRAGEIIEENRGGRYGYPKFHAKVVISDQKVGLVSSANLTFSGMVCNVEIGTMIKKREVKSIIEFVREIRRSGVIYKFSDWALD